LGEVLYVKRTKDENRVIIGIALDGLDGEKANYTVKLSAYENIGSPKAKDRISYENYEIIVRDDEKYRAMKKALSYLAYSDKNKRTLYFKLAECGFSRESISYVIEACVRLGYINEDEQIERIAEKEINLSLKGRAVVVKKLLSKGYKLNDINAVLDRLLDEGKIDFSENFRRLAEKTGAEGEEELNRLAYKYGYRGIDY
jgi:SOS response regulatory protein OraA/RecX